jgi:hypothetical protein
MQPAGQNDLIESILSDPLKLIAALIGVITFLLTLRRFREDSLRRGDVLSWAEDCIRTFENLIVATTLFHRAEFKEECRRRVIDATFDAPTLLERGRIFFKNQSFGSLGAEKSPAYRGLRPKILDPLVAAHQIAVCFFDSDDETQIRLRLLTEDYLRAFVSLVQREIGRERTAAAETKQAGEGFDLQTAIESIAAERVDFVMDARKRGASEYRVPHGLEWRD